MTRIGDLKPRILPLGDAGITLEFGDSIDLATRNKVTAVDTAISAACLGGVIETVPSYRSLLIEYEAALIAADQLIDRVLALPLPQNWNAPAWLGRSWRVPVCYDEPFADDMEEIADRVGMSVDEVIATHAATLYEVYMIGFAPGLPYLGRLPDTLHLPRRERPRAQVAEGSVLIAGMQCLITPMALPSGWHVLGRTPWRCFDQSWPDPFLFRAGDRIRFEPIDRADFESIALEVAAGATMRPVDV